MILPLSFEPQFGTQVKFDFLWNSFVAHCMNLFLSTMDDMGLIKDTLNDMSLAIGSKFNYEKTDVLLFHAIALSKPQAPPLAPLLDCFTGAYILSKKSPLRILGMWVGSPNFARDRWDQIALHIRKIICQWNHIGASIRNRVILAKALLMSHCYYLMDGNGIPSQVLSKISHLITHFVCGRFSSAPYSIIAAPTSEGGLDCPSLQDQKLAYNAKFFSDLISCPHDSLWKVWTLADLSRASSHSLRSTGTIPVDPLTQLSYTTLKLLEPQVYQAFLSCHKLGYDIRCAFPSHATQCKMPALFHPALPSALSQQPEVLDEFGISTVQDLVNPPMELHPIFCHTLDSLETTSSGGESVDAPPHKIPFGQEGMAETR